jgi:hypothetical protein
MSIRSTTFLFGFFIAGIPSIVMSRPVCAQEDCLKEDGVAKLAKQMVTIGEWAIGDRPMTACPSKGYMGALCGHITQGILNKRSGDEKLGKYEYEQTIYEAACLSNSDLENQTDEYIQEKVQALWNRFGKDLNCDSYPGEGNILKTAANEGPRFLES